MAQTKKAIREAYNAKTYRKFGLRVRRDSDLCKCLEQTMRTKDASLNQIITSLLAVHYGVPMPEPPNSK